MVLRDGPAHDRSSRGFDRGLRRQSLLRRVSPEAVAGPAMVPVVVTRRIGRPVVRCPYCNNEEDKVVDSRMAEEGRAIRRRRECLDCSRRYTTFERPEEVPL